MKICFFCDSIFSIGGVQKVLAVIATELSKIHDVTILTMDNKSAMDLNMYNLKESNIHIKFFSFIEINKWEYFTHAPFSGAYKKFLIHNRFTSYLYSLSSFPQKRRKQLIKILNEGNYDIIIGVHAFLSIKLATIRKKLNAKKVIGWMHNSYQAFFENNPAYLDGLKSHFKFQMNKLNDIIVLTKTDAGLYKKNLGLETKVIYNPLTITTTCRCNIGSKTFLSVGRMSYRHKGFDILIKAFTLFCKSNNDWKLNIVGDGPEKDNLEQLIKDCKMERRIKIFPFTQNIQKYYSEANVYVLSSRWEGFPLVLMEALSFGLPVIASDIPVCKELLDNKSFCILFKNEDINALAKNMLLYAESNNLEQYSDKALAFAKHENNLPLIILKWEKIINN